MAATLVIFTTVLIGALWILAQWAAAKKEFSDPALRRNWIIASSLLFLMILSATLAAGASGVLARFDRMPFPAMGIFPFIVVCALYIARSRFGTLLVKHIPLHALIAFHAFRFLAEMIIFSGVVDGIAPRALSFEGYQFDIVTGLSALPVAWYVKKNGALKLAFWWNVMALGFLVVIGFIAMASFPTPLRVFMDEPGNLWVTRLPYTLLPGILVTAALAGQFLVFRKLNFLRA